MIARSPATDGRATEMVVTIVSADPSGTIMCRDLFGNEFEIDGTVRRKGAGFPAADERWVLRRTGNVWMPDALIGAPGLRTITGSRSGLHPVLAQMLDVMAEQGHVLDETTDEPPELILDPVTDPVPPIEADDPTYGYDDEYDPPDPVEDDDPGIIPVADNGPHGKDPSAHPIKTGWVPLYVGSFNVLKDLGPQRAYEDLLRFTSSRIQVFGTQEMHSNARNGIVNRLEGRGWSHYRPQYAPFADENTIFWRTDDFQLLDQGSILLTNHNVPGDHMPPRYLNWVKLRHYDSARPLFFMDTHWDPHIEAHRPALGVRPGEPTKARDQQARVQEAFVQCQKTAEKMQQFGKIAPVFTAGDFNINFFTDAKARDHRFPYAKFRTVNSYSNWELAPHHPRYGTSGSRYIDQVWMTRPTHWQVRAIENFILTGYHSDHRPAMCKVLIHSKN